MKQIGWNMTISFQEGIQALIKNWNTFLLTIRTV
jgi:hypothetical protein